MTTNRLEPWFLPSISMVVFLTLLLAAPLLGGCAEGFGLEDEDPVVTRAGGKADDPNAGSAPTLAPAYGLLVRSHVTERDADTGETSSYTVAMTAVATVQQTGAEVTLTLQPCRAVLPTVGGYQPTVADSAIQNGAKIIVKGTLGGTDQATFTTDRAALLLGLKLSNPLTDPLPADAGSAAVVDQDRDGKPGISIAAAGFKVYAGVRVLFSLDGVLEPDGIAGPATIKSEVEVYGDNVPFVDVKEKLDEAEADYDPASYSYVDSFRLVPARGASLTCWDVLADSFWQ